MPNLNFAEALYYTKKEVQQTHKSSLLMQGVRFQEKKCC